MSETLLVQIGHVPNRQVGSEPGLTAIPAFAIAILGLAVFALSQVPHVTQVWNLVLPDHDDVVRLLGVRDLLAGQSWFDTHQYRYLPPDGVLMHWSRLADAPLAAGIWLLTPLLGQEGAEGMVALVWPPLLFLAYLGIVAAALGRIAPRLAVVVAILIGCQMVVFQYIFRVGRIDHHALQVVLVTSAAIFFAFAQRARAAAPLSGLFCALSLAIGLETLPFVAATGAAFVLAWAFDEDSAASAMVRFGLAFAASAFVAFGVQTAPSLWAAPACDMLSAPWLLIAAGGATTTVLLSLATPLLATPVHRISAAIICGSVLIAGFALAYPQCLAGPYEMVPQPYRDIWLGDILEARPGWLRLANGSDTIFQAFGPLAAAVIAAAVLARKGRGVERRLMTVSAGCLALGVALSLMQVRGLYVASAFVPPVAAFAIWRMVEALRARRLTRFQSTAAALAALAFVGPVWSGPALAVRQVVPTFGPAEHIASDCLLKQNISALDALPEGTILAPIDLGAGFLLYTRHSIVAAGFHRAVEGIVAGIDAFKGAETDMRRVVSQHRPDYLVVCADWAKAATTPAPFARALAQGATVLWLEPVPLDAGSLMVWSVNADALTQ